MQCNHLRALQPKQTSCPASRTNTLLQLVVSGQPNETTPGSTAACHLRPLTTCHLGAQPAQPARQALTAAPPSRPSLFCRAQRWAGACEHTRHCCLQNETAALTSAQEARRGGCAIARARHCTLSACLQELREFEQLAAAAAAEDAQEARRPQQCQPCVPANAAGTHTMYTVL